MFLLYCAMKVAAIKIDLKYDNELAQKSNYKISKVNWKHSGQDCKWNK